MYLVVRSSGCGYVYFGNVWPLDEIATGTNV